LDNDYLSIDLHIHSIFSYDCLNKPKQILQYAKTNNLDAIAITDHHSIKGSEIVKDIERKGELIIISGAEFYSQGGDIIGIFINQNIHSNEILTILDEISEQDGVTILPHPYVGHDYSLLEEIAKRCDIIEGWNSRLSIKNNMKAIELATRLNKPWIANSDAHLIRNIGSSRSIFHVACDEEDLRKKILSGPIKCSIGQSSKIGIRYSQLIKILRLNGMSGIPFFLRKSISHSIESLKDSYIEKCPPWRVEP